MGKTNKAITKSCPFCEMQVAVACKTCPGCKHSIYNAKQRPSLGHSAAIEELGSRRRTERVKREKPNYYDASEFEKKKKKKRLERAAADFPRERGRPPTRELKKKRKKKGTATATSNPAATINQPVINNKISKEIEEDEQTISLPVEKIKQLSEVLAELNRKMVYTTWSNVR